ncbi:MAG: hypothetical protein EBR67_10770 [Proteobacteria bacterium]|nr:hypothetical protein [Pseudomonadota bacterium]
MSFAIIGLDEISGKKDRQMKRDERKKKRKEKREKRGGSILKKFYLAPARAAFFLLMKINFLQLRKKLRAGWKKDKEKIKKQIVRRFGFKESNFLKELNRKENDKLSGYLGVEPASTAAVAQAIPILTAVASVLKNLGIAAGSLTEAKNALTGKDKELANEFESGVENDVNDTPEDDRSKGGGQSADDYKDKPTFGKNNLPLIIGLGVGALAVLYFATKKK